MHKEDSSSLIKRLPLRHDCPELEIQWEFVTELCRKQIHIAVIEHLENGIRNRLIHLYLKFTKIMNSSLRK